MPLLLLSVRVECPSASLSQTVRATLYKVRADVSDGAVSMSSLINGKASHVEGPSIGFKCLTAAFLPETPVHNLKIPAIFARAQGLMG